MRSRFEVCLLTDVQPPDLETRIAILRKKAIQERLSVPDDVLEFIASRISTNIRELEGALIRVTAFASLNRQPVDMSLAEIVLRDLIPDDAASQVTPATIMAQTAAYFGLTLDDLQGQSRSRVLVTARRMNELDLTHDELPAPPPVRTGPRPLTAQELIDAVTDVEGRPELLLDLDPGAGGSHTREAG